jgi:hypothetical protein
MDIAIVNNEVPAMQWRQSWSLAAVLVGATGAMVAVAAAGGDGGNSNGDVVEDTFDGGIG